MTLFSPKTRNQMDLELLSCFVAGATSGDNASRMCIGGGPMDSCAGSYSIDVSGEGYMMEEFARSATGEEAPMTNDLHFIILRLFCRLCKWGQAIVPRLDVSNNFTYGLVRGMYIIVVSVRDPWCDFQDGGAECGCR